MPSPAGNAGARAPLMARLVARPIAPFALALLAAFAACAAFGYVLARESDARHQAQRRIALLGVVDEYRIVFAEMTRRAAAGLSTVPLTAGPDLAGALEPAGLARYRHEHACLVATDGAVIASMPAGSPVPPAVAGVIARFPARSAADDAVDHPASVATEAVLLDGRATLVAVAAVHAPQPPAGGRAGDAILVRAKRLDAGLIDVFERMSGVTALSFDIDEGPRPDREMQPLLDAQGRMVGWLSWQREHPAMDTVVRLLPLICAVATFLVAFAAFAGRRICRAARGLARSEAETHRVAYQDPVTGLPNRRAVAELVDATLAARADGGIVTLGLLGIDAFADVSDALGEQGSDELIAAAAKRLRREIPAAVALGRSGPSAFALVAADAAGAPAAPQAAVKEMARPLCVADQSVQIGVTVGLVRAPHDGETREDLMRRADRARRSTAPDSAVRIAGFDGGMEQEHQDRLFIRRELRRALSERGFDVHYQPIVAAEGQKVIGVEALLRWTHPIRGPIPPAEFIPVAEQMGLMAQVGELVLRRALADAVRWKDVYIAVNLSPCQMRDRGLSGLVAAVIADTGIAPSRVVLEVTEGVLIENPDDAKARLDQLRALGVKIALDDFGSGYSSLSYLRRFPIDKLKIDKEFVAPLGRSSDGGVIIQAIMALGRALGLVVLCEGVETEEQRILLRLAGCDEMQGFLFARPAPRAAIDRLIGGQRGAARRSALA